MTCSETDIYSERCGLLHQQISESDLTVSNAIKNDWLDKDPFKAYRVKLKDTKRVFLTTEELTALEEKQFDIDRLDQVWDVFVFCCYTGLSYVDVEKLTPNGIVKGHDAEYWVTIDRTKTGSPSSVPMLQRRLKLLRSTKVIHG